MSGKFLSPLGFGCREWFKRDYGGYRGGCHGSDVVDDGAEVNGVDAVLT